MTGYDLRAMTRDDLPMIRAWLATPEVVRWWGDPDEQFALVAGDLDEPAMTQWIATLDGVAFGYVQHYPVARWPQLHFAHLPPDAVAMDPFIGVSAMVGQGHGRAMLRLAVERIRAAGAPVVVIDPEPDNLRARRAYAAAGFVGDAIVDAGDGPVVLMTFVP